MTALAGQAPFGALLTDALVSPVGYREASGSRVLPIALVADYSRLMGPA